MACFLVSAAGAAVVGVIEKAVEKKEHQHGEKVLSVDGSGIPENEVSQGRRKVPLSRKLKWYCFLLIGGAFLLMFEHVWHGEVVAWFPFLTAMSDPADMSDMFYEMSTVGVGMFGLITLVWGGMCIAADSILRRSSAPGAADKEVES